MESPPLDPHAESVNKDANTISFLEITAIYPQPVITNLIVVLFLDFFVESNTSDNQESGFPNLTKLAIKQIAHASLAKM